MVLNLEKSHLMYIDKETDDVEILHFNDLAKKLYRSGNSRNNITGKHELSYSY